ncbi:unnamed protein product [Gemmata massiliana]|uniref:Uncharacterized protein n=1 Tax=Gemmata massiliana TaxID=1210884 RepID=A0A6P2CYE1_9BACT|nr:hypothetical protein [Gemmata massiliana]VTR92152.1 unnamed protein product [Gemmata massiliana]
MATLDSTPTTNNWDHYQSPLYRSNGSIDEFELVEGTFVLPVAEDPPTDPEELRLWSPVVIVRGHAPYRKKTVHFKASKSGAPPVLARPESVGALAFLGGTLAFQQPLMDTSLAKFVWEGMGSYSFVENCRSDPDDGFVLTGVPWTTANQAVNYSTGVSGNPQFGAVARAGADAKFGWAVGQAISLNDPAYNYNVATYIPGKFFGSGLLNGEIEIVPAYSSGVQTRNLYPPSGLGS